MKIRPLISCLALVWAAAIPVSAQTTAPATQPTTRPVIVVAAGTSLNAVVARAMDGDEIDLADGDYPLTGELGITRRITLRALNPGKAVIKWDCPTGTDRGWTPEWAQAIYPKANGVVVDGLAFAVTNAKTIRVNGAADVTLRNLTSVASVTAEGKPCGGYWFLDASRTVRLRLENIILPLHASYGIFLHDNNADTTATGVQLNGSVWQHPWRVSDQNGLSFDNCVLRGTEFGPSFKNVGGMSLRGGTRRVRGTNSLVDRLGVGAQTAEETQLVDDVRLDNCVIVAPWMIHPTAGEVANAARTNPTGAGLMKQPTNMWINGTRFDVPAVPTAADVSAKIAKDGWTPDTLNALKAFVQGAGN